jgi:nitric oxide reductase NorD protein
LAEPEELIIEGAHLATRVARDVWRRHSPPSSTETIRLADVRSRLELFVTALFRATIQLLPIEPPSKATWLARLARGRTHDPRVEPFVSGTDGERIFLPRELPRIVTARDGLEVYRLLAVQQAARVDREIVRTAARASGDRARDWFLLATAATVDLWIVREIPGFRPILDAVRGDALTRILRTRKAAGEGALALETRALLGGQRTPRLAGLGADAPAAECLEWAESIAREDAAENRCAVPPVWYCGRIFPAAGVRVTGNGQAPDAMEPRTRPFRVAEMRRRPKPRQASDDEDDEGTGMWVIRADEPQESVEDPCGMQRPADRDEKADAEGLADSLSELPEARVVRTPERAHEVLRSDDVLPRTAHIEPGRPVRRGISYPEWDYRAGAYRTPGAVVHEPVPPLGDPGWIASALTRHAKLARQVRSKFERLRPRRERLRGQLDGADIDINAYVTAASDMRAGGAVEGKFYVTSRPARRELSVALLVDVSASTDAWVAPDRRIIDVEKEALLVVCGALDALGDPYGIFAFSGESAGNVSVLGIKGFHERNSHAVRRRIAALDYDRYTRLGAAIRHVTAALGRQQTSRRLLLVLSDGKPNDVDAYEGRYGVEDTRQAIAEARRQGIVVFCLTVDREAPRYAVRIFGRSGFAVLRKPDQLPFVLIEALRRLIKL